ncbi:MAG: DUF6431 domain-containing protein [Eubacteriales bacterium]
MVIISNYKILSNENDTYFIESHETPSCPLCNSLLRYRDMRLRIERKEGGEVRFIAIRRLKCPHCNRLHTELPDILVPYKHYSEEVISGVIDDIITPSDMDSESYPCETTMAHWKMWFKLNQVQIEGYLKSIGFRLLGYQESFLKSPESLLENLRNTLPNWLGSVLRTIYNSGGYLQAFSC